MWTKHSSTALEMFETFFVLALIDFLFSHLVCIFPEPCPNWDRYTCTHLSRDRCNANKFSGAIGLIKEPSEPDSAEGPRPGCAAFAGWPIWRGGRIGGKVRALFDQEHTRQSVDAPTLAAAQSGHWRLSADGHKCGCGLFSSSGVL